MTLVKRSSKARKQYMLLEMKLHDVRMDGREESRAKSFVRACQRLDASGKNAYNKDIITYYFESEFKAHEGVHHRGCSCFMSFFAF